MKIRRTAIVALALLFIIGDAIFGLVTGVIVAAVMFVAFTPLGGSVALLGGLVGLAMGIMVWDFVLLPYVWRTIDSWLAEKHGTSAEQVIEKFFE